MRPADAYIDKFIPASRFENIDRGWNDSIVKNKNKK